MELTLSNVVPTFFDAAKAGDSEVWNQPLRFNLGESVHIISPSGSGKTSLVHFLYGLRKDYRGSISYADLDFSTFDTEQLAHLRQSKVSIVFQDLRLFTALSVVANIEIKRALSSYAAAASIDDMAMHLGIKDKLNQPCHTCSYGEQQRIAIIRALQQPYDFLLLDEPFSHLDEANRIKAMELIEWESAKRSACIILADLREIEYFKAERKLHL